MLEGGIESRQRHRSDAGEAHCNSILAAWAKQAVLLRLHGHQVPDVGAGTAGFETVDRRTSAFSTAKSNATRYSRFATSWRAATSAFPSGSIQVQRAVNGKSLR